MYSSSALRYSLGLAELPEKEAVWVSSYGPGVPENYLIHQLEPLSLIMKAPAERVLYTPAADTANYRFTFRGGKTAAVSLFGWNGDAPFSMTVRFADGSILRLPDAEGYFDRFIGNLVRFFETGEGAVDKEQTISVMAMIEAARKAEEAPGEWVEIRE